LDYFHQVNKKDFRIKFIDFIESGFIICDDPHVAESAYNRHKYLNRFLCWISPQLLYTSILDKQKAIGPTLPLRVLTATLADRVGSLINNRQVTSPNTFNQQVKINQMIKIEIIVLDHFREIHMKIQIQVLLLRIH
jgi:hypothetical protein